MNKFDKMRQEEIKVENKALVSRMLQIMTRKRKNNKSPYTNDDS